MDRRQDALTAASEIVLAAEAVAREHPSLRATVGRLNVAPNAGNVIPGRVSFGLDVRDPDSEVVENAVAHLLAQVEAVSRRRGLTWTHEVLNRQPCAAADPYLSGYLGQAAAAVTGTDHRMLIGAGHDAMIMGEHMPMAMLMIRTPGGLSHHPDESVACADVDVAVQAMIDFVERLANELRSGHHQEQRR